MSSKKCEVPLELSDHQVCTCVADGNDYDGTVGSGSSHSADKPGVTPLHVVCTHADLQVILFLLEKGAAVNAPTFNQSLTPLQVG